MKRNKTSFDGLHFALSKDRYHGPNGSIEIGMRSHDGDGTTFWFRNTKVRRRNLAKWLKAKVIPMLERDL